MNMFLVIPRRNRRANDEWLHGKICMYLHLQVWKGLTGLWQKKGRNTSVSRNKMDDIEWIDRLQLCGISWLVCCVPQEGHGQQTGEGRMEIQTFNDNLEQKYQIGKTTLK